MSLTPKILVFFAALLISCKSPSYQASRFFDLDAADRLRTFSKMSLTTQYQMYQFGFSNTHPPTLELAEPIADNGIRVVPFLLDHLLRTKEDNEVYGIAFIFGIMDAKNIFHVKDDFIADSIFKNRVSKIEDNDIKRLCLSAAGE
ncbi:MAG: hypothetical protein ABL974_00975 [Prosthecobacter sp.]